MPCLLATLIRAIVSLQGSDLEYERRVLELLEFEAVTMMRESEQLKNSILELATGISSISENQNLPILLNILMDGIRAYNSMVTRQPKSSGSLLEMSFWSIEKMDTIYATNGGNTTLLDYTLEKIQDQFPSILNTFDEINYLEKISTRCSIGEIYRGVLRLNFGLDERIKALEEGMVKQVRSGRKDQNKPQSRHECDQEVVLKISNLREASDFLKNEFISLIKDILFFSKYLGIDDRRLLNHYESDADCTKETYDDLISEIETVCEMFQNGQTHKTREIMDKIISDLEITEFEEILGALSLLNWLKDRVSICLGRDLENNIQRVSEAHSNKQHYPNNGDLVDEDTLEDERLLNHQETRYYGDV